MNRQHRARVRLTALLDRILSPFPTWMLVVAGLLVWSTILFAFAVLGTQPNP